MAGVQLRNFHVALNIPLSLSNPPPIQRSFCNNGEMLFLQRIVIDDIFVSSLCSLKIYLDFKIIIKLKVNNDRL
jgi:hypothetical protein